jgi:hypothetical protein
MITSPKINVNNPKKNTPRKVIEVAHINPVIPTIETITPIQVRTAPTSGAEGDDGDECSLLDGDGGGDGGRLLLMLSVES